MKNFNNIVIAVTAVVIFTSCVSTTKEIQKRSTSAKMDVFVENPEGIAPAGFVDIVIKASIKNRLDVQSAPEINIFGQENPRVYPFLLNIDGQAVLWMAEGQEDTSPFYNAEGLHRNPDAGVGNLYRFEKKIRLTVGLHKINFGLPNKDYLSAFKVVLSEGDSQVLEFKPRYHYKSKIDRTPTFLKGLVRYEAVLNKQAVAAVISDYSLYGFTAFLPDF